MWRRVAVGAWLGLALVGCRPGATDVHLVVETRDADGNILAGVDVAVSGESVGTSDHRGVFERRLRRRPGDRVDIEATLARDDATYAPWIASFVVGEPDPFSKRNLDLRLVATMVRLPDALPAAASPTPSGAPQTFAVIVQEHGRAVEGADVYVDHTHGGVTGTDGVYRHPIRTSRELTVLVDKAGLARWKRTVAVAPGRQLIVNLSEAQPVDWTVRALRYGKLVPIPDATVFVNGESVGKTDADGELFYNHPDADAKKLEVAVTAPAHLPARRSGFIRLTEGASFDVRFAPRQAPRPRIGLLPVQMADEGDLERVPAQVVSAFRKGLESAPFMDIVPIDPLALAGHERPAAPPPMSSLDGLAVLSIDAGVAGYTIEATLLSPNGEIGRAALRTSVAPAKAHTVAHELGAELTRAWPVEGAVTAIDVQGVHTNVVGLEHGDELTVYQPTTLSGEVWDPAAAPERRVGTLRVTSTARGTALARADGALKAPLQIGDRLVRERRTSMHAHQVDVAVAEPGGARPVAGANVYLDGVWAGSTDTHGVAHVWAEYDRAYALLLYKKGRPPVTDEVTFEANEAVPPFFLGPEGTLRVEGEPAGAEISIDGAVVASMPMLEPVKVPPGLRRIRVSAPGYLAWEQTLRFDGSPVELTGSRQVRLVPDVLARGAEREASGDYAAAAAAYAQADAEHPDYALARTRRARVLLEELNDAPGAVKELLPLVDSAGQDASAASVERRLLLGRALMRRGESAEGPFATAADLQHAAAVLTTVARDAPRGANARTQALYLRALALQHLHTLDPDAQSADRARAAWDRFLSEAPLDAHAERSTARRLREELSGWDPVN